MSKVDQSELGIHEVPKKSYDTYDYLFIFHSSTLQMTMYKCIKWSLLDTKLSTDLKLYAHLQ